jgi:hypothetical protein
LSVPALAPTEGKTMRKAIKIVHEGKYAAEIPVELIEDSGGWSPYLSTVDAAKLDAVRKALRAGDVAAATKHGQVFELLPLPAQLPADRPSGDASMPK